MAGLSGEVRSGPEEPGMRSLLGWTPTFQCVCVVGGRWAKTASDLQGWESWCWMKAREEGAVSSFWGRGVRMTIAGRRSRMAPRFGAIERM